MDVEILKDQIDFAQARIEEIEKQVINTEPDAKGYKELVEGYNKWIDRYNDLLNQLEHFNDVDIDRENLELEKEKLQIEQDKINLEAERIRLDREKFAHDVEATKKHEAVDVIFRSAELGVKVAVPLIALAGTIAIAKLAYVNDTDMKLCDGRVFAGAKDLIRLATMKI